METFRFSYVQKTTGLRVTALGVERSWEQLQAEFNRHSPGFPGATYYKTISLIGPQLFAVVNNTLVLYHDNEQWFRYISAADIQIGRMNIMLDEPERATTQEQSDVYFAMAAQEEHISIENQDQDW